MIPIFVKVPGLCSVEGRHRRLTCSLLHLFHLHNPKLGHAGTDCLVGLALCTPARRALAFAHDVELRLRPWYGRSRSPVPRGGELHGEDCPPSLGGGREGGGHESSRLKAGDLLACGCALAEMCAGEPVLSGPSFVDQAGARGDGGRRRGAVSWLEAAVDLPQVLRGAIGALTHADPTKVGKGKVCPRRLANARYGGGGRGAGRGGIGGYLRQNSTKSRLRFKFELSARRLLSPNTLQS